MKKFVYLCGMMLLSMNIMAQIDLNDKNWDTVFIDDFSGNRYWDRHWDETNGDDPNYNPIWRCFPYEAWASGVTLYDSSDSTYHSIHAYQPSQAVFETDSTMKLISVFKSTIPLHCGNSSSDTSYCHAPWLKYCHYCDSFPLQHPDVHYYSGMIETINPVSFGYYEIECKMPIHPGACSAFWLYSSLGGTYNEIDIFEHCKSLCPNNLSKETLSGIWYNPIGTNYKPIKDDYGNIIVPQAQRFANKNHILPNTSNTLEYYHKYGCLWLPDKVEFYVDGNIVNECNVPEQIPQFPMWLKITHNEDKYANYKTLENPEWRRIADEMTINYVKVYRLKSSCDSILTVRSNTDLSNYFSVKNSITMGAQTGILTLTSNHAYTFRAVESITIDGGFEVPVGTELTLITQECPEWSFEGLDLPSYNCGMGNISNLNLPIYLSKE